MVSRPKADLGLPEHRAERRLQGVGTASGIAIGPVFILSHGVQAPPRRSLSPTDLPLEKMRFATAIAAALLELDEASAAASNLPPAAREDIVLLLDAHRAMLQGSRLTRGVEGRITRNRINAEAAIEAEIDAIAKSFATIDDSYLAARIQDVRAVGNRLLRLLLSRPERSVQDVPKGAILLADELTPADTARFTPGNVKGIATASGGAEGHTAIMARALSLPAVMSVGNLLQDAVDGEMVIIDGREGLLIFSPTAATLEIYKLLAARIAAHKKDLGKLKNLPARTEDGVDVNLFANVELPAEIPAVLQAGAEGIGLFRTEFLFLGRDTLPSEDEQFDQLRQMVEGMKGRPVTIRTLDVGGDKIAAALSHHHEAEANPALGLRAIRLGLKQPELLLTQFCAILRASWYGPVRIMLPMISSVDEVLELRRLYATAVRRLRRRHVPIADSLPPIGIMIEIPSAALLADELAEVADFFSIGTNDLTQYTLAVDRSNKQVAHLYNSQHDAVLKLIGMTVAAANRARIPIAVCGEIAGDTRATATLLRLGVRNLSMSPSLLPAVKREIRAMTLSPPAKE